MILIVIDRVGLAMADFPLTQFSMGAVSRAPFIKPAVRPKTAAMETQPKGAFTNRSRARTASKNCYFSHIILHTVRALGMICESPLSG